MKSSLWLLCLALAPLTIALVIVRPSRERHIFTRPLISQRAASKCETTSSTVTAKEIVHAARKELTSEYDAIDLRTQRHLDRVLAALREQRVGPSELSGGLDGYAHGDLGREAIDGVFAAVLGADAALVRSQIFSGTHAIACALFGVLRPGDTMLAVSGPPYDTLEEVIGQRRPTEGSSSDSSCDGEISSEESPGPFAALPLDGNLKEWGIDYQEVNLTTDGYFNLPAIDAALYSNPNVRLLHVQRSCGYQWRPSIPIAEIERLCVHIKARNNARRTAAATLGEEATFQPLVVFVDNCYGEFVEDLEPCAVGADLCAGSLIKNLGGTLARTGGYVAGKGPLVQAAARRLSAPGVGGGATLGQNKWILQGLFQAPGTVGESVKGALLLAQVLGEHFGFPCNPPPLAALATAHNAAPATTSEADGSNSATKAVASLQQEERIRPRTDIVQAVQLGGRQELIAFCEAMQRHSPVGSYIRPTPGVTPGYGGEVIFADGSFVDGATAELSCDGPLREPYTVFVQGGTHHMHWALVLEAVVADLLKSRDEQGGSPSQYPLF